MKKINLKLFRNKIQNLIEKKLTCKVKINRNCKKKENLKTRKANFFGLIVNKD
jgi:hypothetical protein